jgi:hypothetical protein
MTSIKSLISAAPSSNQSFTFARLYGDFFGANTANFSSLVLIAQHYNQATPAGLWYADCYDTGELDFDDLAAVGADLNQREAAANSGAGKFKGVGGNSKGRESLIAIGDYV